jgi:hypothetical protein
MERAPPAGHVLLPLWEKVACEAGRMRGLADITMGNQQLNPMGPVDPSSGPFGATFSHRGRRMSEEALHKPPNVGA